MASCPSNTYASFPTYSTSHCLNKGASLACASNHKWGDGRYLPTTLQDTNLPVHRAHASSVTSLHPDTC